MTENQKSKKQPTTRLQENENDRDEKEGRNNGDKLN